MERTDISFENEFLEVKLELMESDSDRFFYISGFSDNGIYTDGTHIVNEVPMKEMVPTLYDICRKAYIMDVGSIYMESQVRIKRKGKFVNDPWKNELLTMGNLGFMRISNGHLLKYLQIRDKDYETLRDVRIVGCELKSNNKISSFNNADGYDPIVKPSMTNIVLNYKIKDITN